MSRKVKLGENLTPAYHVAVVFLDLKRVQFGAWFEAFRAHSLTTVNKTGARVRLWPRTAARARVESHGEGWNAPVRVGVSAGKGIGSRVAPFCLLPRPVGERSARRIQAASTAPASASASWFSRHEGDRDGMRRLASREPGGTRQVSQSRAPWR
ncbi:unnamed protein product [Lampetra planeri]